MELSYDNCPPPFVSFLRVWANTVPAIQSLVPEAQHDLARVICGLQPLLQDSENMVVINGIAADLRAVAIEISQRRSFQDRYASDLQAALDAGAGPDSPSSRKTSFVPPPVYDSSSSSSNVPLRPMPVPQPSPGLLSSSIPHSATSSKPSPSSQSLSHSLFRQDSPAIEFIRETLYASLADVLERQPSLRQLLKRDPPRAYFASVAFAILDVSTSSMNPDGSVIGILGKRLTVSECPRELQPFMIELSVIGQQAKSMDEEDNQHAMMLAQQGRSDDIPLSRLDRVRLMWEKGVGYEHDHDDGGGRRSVEGRAVAFANKVNALGLALTKLKPFKERQEYVFKVLGGIGS
jgi:hypothetical protein